MLPIYLKIAMIERCVGRGIAPSQTRDVFATLSSRAERGTPQAYFALRFSLVVRQKQIEGRLRVLRRAAPAQDDKHAASACEFVRP
ncbi:MAG: hypothetical protein H0X40_08135 [Chthoniobacterales bacterium]|nr:hypothetical protein [Chthoniobacterales bacterium]